MTSLNDLLEAAKAVEDDKGKKIVQKLQKLGFFLKILRSTWPVLFPRGSYAKKSTMMFTTFLIFFVTFLEMISPYKRKRYRRDIERTQG